MKETIDALKSTVAVLLENLDKAAEGNKSAAARARKATLELQRLGHDFRRQSIEAARAGKE